MPHVTDCRGWGGESGRFLPVFVDGSGVVGVRSRHLSSNNAVFWCDGKTRVGKSEVRSGIFEHESPLITTNLEENQLGERQGVSPPSLLPLHYR